MSWPFSNLLMFKYEVVIADPPWQFDLRSEKGNGKAASAQYKTMPLVAIKALPVANLVRHDSLLLLWTTGWAMATGQAQDVARAWGAEPVTELVWLKTTVNGKARMGTGYRARTMHEPILLAKWGNPKHGAFPSSFDGLAREHSRKPKEFYDLVQRKTLGAYRCDLFSRENRPGFEGWGNEHGKFDAGMQPMPARPAVEPRKLLTPPGLFDRVHSGVPPLHTDDPKSARQQEPRGDQSQTERAESELAGARGGGQSSARTPVVHGEWGAGESQRQGEE